MESTLFTALSSNEEANLSGGGFFDTRNSFNTNVAISDNAAFGNKGDVAQNSTAVANSGDRNRLRIRNRARA